MQGRVPARGWRTPVGGDDPVNPYPQPGRQGELGWLINLRLQLVNRHMPRVASGRGFGFAEPGFLRGLLHVVRGGVHRAAVIQLDSDRRFLTAATFADVGDLAPFVLVRSGEQADQATDFDEPAVMPPGMEFATPERGGDRATVDSLA